MFAGDAGEAETALELEVTVPGLSMPHLLSAKNRHGQAYFIRSQELLVAHGFDLKLLLMRDAVFPTHSSSNHS